MILPLAPNEDLGPYHAFNPFSIWLMVVLISALGFAAYVAMRIFGTRMGVLLTSFLGGLTSSTATTLAFSRRSRQAPHHSTHFELAVIVACTVMLPRLLVIAAVISAPFALQLLVPFGLMAVPGLIFVGWTWWWQRPERRTEDVPAISNPLGLPTALKFGALYALVTFLVKAAPALGWTQSLLPLSFVSGFTSADAILLSLAHTYAADEGLRALAVRGAVLGVIGNTLLKAGIASATGSPGVRRWTLVVLGATAAIGVAWLFLAGNLSAPPAA